ncbi:MAG: endonuclease domain-containing protein [Prevotella sp.]|nr:endonuclease domain-containing protein [Prevotella sp.]
MHYPTAKANIAEQRVYRKALRNSMTPAECILWHALKGRAVGGLKFRRQQGIGPFILDFYCPGHRLGIEIDGASHDYKYEYDEERTAYLRQQGIRILRFSNQQVFSCLQGVLTEIVRVANEATDPTPGPSPTREGSGCA